MALIRKAAAGSDSFGHVWPEDGAVVEIEDPGQIDALVAIPDGGFSEVTPGGDEEPHEPPQTPDDDGKEEDAKKEVSEIDPNAPADEPEARTPAKKTAARKSAASKPVQE